LSAQPEENHLFSHKLHQLESRLDNHTQRVEDRLDQLVDLMRQVAVLQDREMKNADTIREIKDGIRRSHERIDAIVTQIETNSDTLKTHYSLHSEKESDKIFGVIDKLDCRLDDTEAELRSWLNRGKGAWYVMLFTFVLVQSGGAYLFSQLVDRLDKIETNQQQSNKRFNELEINVFDVWKKVSEK
jgi:vacuolar-type H+-ATPase subunit I/STV1